MSITRGRDTGRRDRYGSGESKNAVSETEVAEHDEVNAAYGAQDVYVPRPTVTDLTFP